MADITSSITSSRANGSRERAPDDRLRDAIQRCEEGLDCFVALLLAMTGLGELMIWSDAPHEGY
jgi:hypothetical protein